MGISWLSSWQNMVINDTCRECMSTFSDRVGCISSLCVVHSFICISVRLGSQLCTDENESSCALNGRETLLALPWGEGTVRKACLHERALCPHPALCQRNFFADWHTVGFWKSVKSWTSFSLLLSHHSSLERRPLCPCKCVSSDCIILVLIWPWILSS